MSNAVIHNNNASPAEMRSWFETIQRNKEAAIAAVKRPLPEGDIRSLKGRPYLSGGDILHSLWEDLGPFSWETEVKRLEWEPARIDKRETGRNSKTNEVEHDEGWTCIAVCVITVHFILPDGTRCRRDGVGTATSEMQPLPESAVENAVKGAETDAIKRACVGLGPRYGLALRFKDRDEQVSLGMVEINQKVAAARAAQAAEKNTKAQSNPPEKSVGTASPAGALPAGTNTKGSQPTGVRSTGDAAPPAGTVPAGNPHAADDAARREALKKGEVPVEVVAARAQVEALITKIQDAGLRERATSSIKTTRTLEEVAKTRAGVEKILGKQGEKKPDPQSGAAGSAPPATAASPASSSAAGASASAAAPVTTTVVPAAPAAPATTSPSTASTPAATQGREITVDFKALDGGKVDSSLGVDFSSVPDQRDSLTNAENEASIRAVAAEDAKEREAIQSVAREEADEAARLRAIQRLMKGEFDPALTTALKVGAHPGAVPAFDDVKAYPSDPTANDLIGVGWSASGAAPEELALIGPGDPVPMPMQSAVIGEAMRRITRDQFALIWKGLGGPAPGGLASGYQLRLIAWTVGYRSQKAAAK